MCAGVDELDLGKGWIELDRTPIVQGRPVVQSSKFELAINAQTQKLAELPCPQQPAMPIVAVLSSASPPMTETFVEPLH